MIWILLLEAFDDKLPEGATMERLLWGLLLMNGYDTEINNASHFQPLVLVLCEGNFRLGVPSCKSYWFLFILFVCFQKNLLTLCHASLLADRLGQS